MVNGHILGMPKSLFHSVVLAIKSKVIVVSRWMAFISFSFFPSTPAETKELVSWMRGHDSAVSSISIHGSGRYAITTSTDTAQLWDLDTFQRKRKLNVRQSVGIQKVSEGQLLKGEQGVTMLKPRYFKMFFKIQLNLFYVLWAIYLTVLLSHYLGPWNHNSVAAEICWELLRNPHL